MHVTIRPLDPSSDAELTQYDALNRALDEHARGGSEHQTLEQIRADLADTAYWRTQRWVAEVEPVEGGRTVVGRAAAFLPQQENLEKISVGASVHPAHRGHGIGTALLEQALVPAIRASERTLVEAYGEIPADGDPDDPSLPANRLAARLGLGRTNVAVCRILPLPVEADLLDRLGAEAAAELGEYRVEIWGDTIPEEHLVPYGLLMRQLDLDDPDEETENEPADYTPERIRVAEQRLRDAGTQRILAVAVAPDGSFVGNSEVHVSTSPRTTLGWQENTLVMPEHRGHRLGLALKVATHRLLSERAAHVRRVATWNSHVNPWMIGINEKLGYQVAYREVVYQGRPRMRP